MRNPELTPLERAVLEAIAATGQGNGQLHDVAAIARRVRRTGEAVNRAATRRVLTLEQRQASAQQAAKARWKRTPKAERREAALKAIRARWAKTKKNPRS